MGDVDFAVKPTGIFDKERALKFFAQPESNADRNRQTVHRPSVIKKKDKPSAVSQ